MTSSDATSSSSPSAIAPPATVALAGIGLLGGSLGLALRRLPVPPRILGWARRPEAVREALDLGCIDEGSTDSAAVLPRADLTIICLPVLATAAFAETRDSQWRPGSVVTDVGSTKAELTARLTPRLAARGVHFVGSHPMAGSEQSGMRHARADLYRDATVFVTPDPRTDPDAAGRVESFWKELGARPFRIHPREHDRLTAHTSHALHLLAAAAVHAVLDIPNAVAGTAGGFRDFSRIASSSPDMWTEIFLDNRDCVLDALDHILDELRRGRDAVERHDARAIHEFLDSARARRDAWLDAWQKRRANPLPNPGE